VLPNPLRSDQPDATRHSPAQPDTMASRPLQPGEPPSQLADEPAKPPPSRKGKRSGEPFDPIKENGPIFVGWPKPQAALVISGRQIGYLEPCGCAGLDRMKGGMGRRHTLMKTLAAKGWPAVGLDVGGVAKGFGKQAELKFATAIEGMRKMGYSVVGLGVEELRLPAGLLVSLGADTPTQPGLFLSANVALFGFDAKLTPRSRVLTLGGKKIGVTAVLGKRFQKQIQSNELELSDPHKALGGVLPELAKQADFLVLLAYTAMDEAVELAKSFPRFDLVVVAEGPAEPPDRFIEVEGVKARFVAVGEKGMNVVVVGLYDDPRQPLRYQRVPLDSRFEGSREMQMLMAAYQDQLKALGFAGLDLRPVPHPQQQTNGNFVSSKKCQSCHEESYRIWRRSRHAIAFDTLVNLDPPRLPRRRLASYQVLPLSGRISKRGENSGAGRRGMRCLPRAGGGTCSGRNGQRQATTGPNARSSAHHQGRSGRPHLEESKLLLVPRPGQQPGFQLRRVLARRRTLRRPVAADGHC